MAKVHHPTTTAHRRTARWLAAAAIGLFVATPAAVAQTDYFNTDAGRPITVEDAYPIERRALELQLAPLRVERAAGGVYTWTLEPEIAWGILPRTQVELGVPLAFRDHGLGESTAGVAGIDLGMLHNLNTETSIPALAVAGELLIPVGNLGPDMLFASARAIATKSFSFARFHLNGQYTFGEEPDAGESIGIHEPSRWLAGIAVDRTFPLRALLVTAEVVARRPIIDDEDFLWDVGAGLRYQYDPRIALDAGIGRQLTGDERTWSFTFGGAYAVGLSWYR